MVISENRLHVLPNYFYKVLYVLYILHVSSAMLVTTEETFHCNNLSCGQTINHLTELTSYKSLFIPSQYVYVCVSKVSINYSLCILNI